MLHIHSEDIFFITFILIDFGVYENIPIKIFFFFCSVQLYSHTHTQKPFLYIMKYRFLSQPVHIYRLNDACQGDKRFAYGLVVGA